MHRVRVAEEFSRGMTSIYSESVLGELRNRMLAIASFPLSGAASVRGSIALRYGPGVRRFPAPPFVIICRYDEVEDAVEFLALPYARAVR